MNDYDVIWQSVPGFRETVPLPTLEVLEIHPISMDMRATQAGKESTNVARLQISTAVPLKKKKKLVTIYVRCQFSTLLYLLMRRLC